ncbi:MAG TPA: hypothetical protein PLA68_16835, partial [Panacibacter sp.]|nr:hypothetical protein [Panacibacter sp.]
IINVTKNGNVYANETAVSPGAENLFDTANSKSLADTATIALSQTKKQPVKIQASKKWEWGITALYGRADVVENLLNIGADFEKSYAQDYTNSTGNNESYNFNVSKQVKAKSAFSAGIAFKKQLTYRSSFISGIQYTKLSTQIETGTRKDSAVRFYYNSVSNAPVAALNSFFTPGSYSLHTNTYHLLQVPVIYEHRLNKSKNIIINWNAGLSISRLLGSNALVFDQGNQAFYHNNGLFRKTQAEMLAGLNIRFDLSKKATLNLGPQLNYSLSNLFGSSSYGNQHYINYGLKSTVFFK